MTCEVLCCGMIISYPSPVLPLGRIGVRHLRGFSSLQALPSRNETYYHWRAGWKARHMGSPGIGGLESPPSVSLSSAQGLIPL
jgi:hypothetical protein